VYTVDERRTSLVLSSRLEAAVRDGDVRDLMLARDADHVLLKLRKGKNVSLDLSEFVMNGVELLEGQGPGEVARKREEERRRRASAVDDRRKMFEDRELRAVAEERRAAAAKAMRVKVGGAASPGSGLQRGSREWSSFQPEELRTDAHIYLSCGRLQTMVQPLVGKFDETKFSAEAPIIGTPTVTQLPQPVHVEPKTVDLETSTPGIVQQPYIAEEMGGFPTVHAVAPFSPPVAEPDEKVDAAIRQIDPGSLPKPAELKAILMDESHEGGKLLNNLPRIDEIPELVNSLETGVQTEVGLPHGPKVRGLKLDIASANRLVIGETVRTPQGDLFVPGQRVEGANGPIFMPGITVHTPDGPMLIPGRAISTAEPDGTETNVFVAGMSLATREGEKFVQGQVLHNADDSRFVPGQTVLTPEGPRFVPGQVVKEGNGEPEFVVGQTVMTREGPEFVPGQTLTTPTGETFFLPGQSVQVERNGRKDWEFVPGQTAKLESGEVQFIPGQSILTAEGTKFVAGQTVIDSGNTPKFVPGMTVKDESGQAKFIPGTSLETAEGLQFIQGQVLKTEKGMKFAPGNFVLGPDGVSVVEFTSALTLNEVVFKQCVPPCVPINPATVSTSQNVQKEEVLGHMIMTDHGVEFFPGKSAGLPSGKLIQGKLVKSPSGVQFVPGMVHDGVFVPGQIVMTDHGEQFVPGQVVDTSEGPKFVPGQIIETHAGPKFLPGQTVMTPEGPKFVPGQIVETKAGPTFIPGQVIQTEDEGSRFVPGQIVETKEGPRFVPGRVIETGDRVTFVPGQIVETADGLRFVAPDLQDTEEGGFEFSVQGFEVTPEELRLMRPHLSVMSNIPTAGAEMSIDSRMLRQLSHAGMAVGKHVQAELPGVDVTTMPTLEAAEQLGLEGVAAVKMGQVLETILKLSFNLFDNKGHLKRRASLTIEKSLNGGVESQVLSQEEEALKNMLTEAIVTACITLDDNQVDHAEQERIVLHTVSNFFNSILESVPDKEGVVDALYGFVILPGHVGLLCKETVIQLGLEHQLPAVAAVSKIELIKSAVWSGEPERFARILQDDAMGQAFMHLVEAEPHLLERVMREVAGMVSSGEVETDQDATEMLQRAIVNAVREASERDLHEMLLEKDERALRALLLQAVNLARALGMRGAAQGLLAVLNDPSATRVLAGDRITLDILRRLTVMRQLAKRRPKLGVALGRLVSEPDSARTDPRLRELVRESAALMVVPEDAPPLESSADIPMSLFENCLAMEDFLGKAGVKARGALLIFKHGFQTVIPREAARDVLTGQVAYSLLDEKGLRHFEPLHVFSALRLSRPSAHRFPMYGGNSGSTSPTESSRSLSPIPGGPAPEARTLRCVHGGIHGGVHDATDSSISSLRTASSDAPPLSNGSLPYVS